MRSNSSSLVRPVATSCGNAELGNVHVRPGELSLQGAGARTLFPTLVIFAPASGTRPAASLVTRICALPKSLRLARCAPKE